MTSAQRLVRVEPLAVSKRFGRYKDEGEHAVRAPDLTEDRVLGQLKEALLKVRLKDDPKESELDFIILPALNYPVFLRAIRGLKYTSKDIEKFSIQLAEFQNTEDFTFKAGHFLSALINKSPESDFIIHTRHLDVKIEHLGWSNTKNIVIEGDSGDLLASFMLKGRITVKGNSGMFTCYGMKKGEIVINGDSGPSLGWHMKGGEITVKGNTGTETGQGMTNGKIVICGNSGDFLGAHMRGGKIIVQGDTGIGTGIGMISGEIRIEGDCKSFDDNVKRGKIYHKGKLIFPRDE
jgi:hypothetical protein